MDVRPSTQALYDAGPQAVEGRLLALEEQIAVLTARLTALEGRLAKNSRNSSLPPSSDLPKLPRSRKRSLREATDRSPGGQAGHPGRTLEPVAQPDQEMVHRPAACGCCGHSLAAAEEVDRQSAQVFDLPPLSLEVVAHVALQLRCPHCHTVCAAELPPGVRPGTQWGARLQALALYLDEYQLQSLSRVQETLRDLFGQAPSQGSLARWRELGERAVQPLVEAIREAVTQAEVAHFDETGVRVDGRGAWVHVASTRQLTYYAHHTKRGRGAWADLDILPRFEGTSVHDGLVWYFDPAYPCQHALCNAHLLRELTGLWDTTHQTWTQRLMSLLRSLKRATDRAKEAGQTSLAAALLARYHTAYRTIVSRALTRNPRPPQARRGGPPLRGPTRSLLERLEKYEAEVLRFAHDFAVPFDNNQAERDLRMVKLQQKTSGCFRSAGGADSFCTIRSYLSTMRKQGHGLLQVLTELCRGVPVWPGGMGG